jgi:hypothetical protein
VSRWTLALALVGAAALALALGGVGTSHVQAKPRLALSSQAEPTQPAAQRCFGAAARIASRRCGSARVQSEVVPTPAQARDRANAPCTIIETRGPLRVCEFGAPAATASDTIALVGDSHAAHWRAAVEVAAKAKNWRGLSITLSGCPYSTITRVLPEPLPTLCRERNREVPQWFADHPEIHTVFVSELSGATWDLPPSQTQFAGQVSSYLAAWSKLPDTVRHIVVIRDDPKDLPRTRTCIQRALNAGDPSAGMCAVPRRAALDRDAAVVAAHRLGSPHAQVLDLTRYFCDPRHCFPVIGGALVHKDLHHMTAVFVNTLGPFLLKDLSALALD